MKEATYRVIRFPGILEDRYIGVAWNYDLAVLVSTHDHATYTEARKDLDKMCGGRGVKLRWFDGSYVYDKALSMLIPDDKTHSD